MPEVEQTNLSPSFWCTFVGYREIWVFFRMFLTAGHPWNKMGKILHRPPCIHHLQMRGVIVMSTKYIFVTGGVVSGLGKGIAAASLGRLLKEIGRASCRERVFDIV